MKRGARDDALAKRDIHAFVAALSNDFAMCQCTYGLPCSRPHVNAGETPAQALLRRLKDARDDPNEVTPNPETGDVEHTRYGLLGDDLDLIIRALERRTPTTIGAAPNAS